MFDVVMIRCRMNSTHAMNNAEANLSKNTKLINQGQQEWKVTGKIADMSDRQTVPVRRPMY